MDNFDKNLHLKQTIKPLEVHIDETSRNEIVEILKRTNYGAISQVSLSYLVPKRVYEIAKNQNNIELRQLNNIEGEISIIIIERNYPNELTSTASYSQWKKDIEKAKQEQKKQMIKILPPAPKGVNRLHEKFSSNIDQGNLSFYDRILMICRLRLYPDNHEALYVADFDGEFHQRIGQDFYKNTLPAFCKNLNLRFIVGENNGKNFSFFKDVLGRYKVNELKPQYQNILFPKKLNDRFFTIQFLYPEDIEKYIQK